MPPGAMETKPRAVCRFFQGGNCRYGSRCRFLHEVGPTQTPIHNEDNVTNSSQELNTTVSGTVSTSLPSEVQSTANSENAIKAVRRVNKPCRAWKYGSCNWGNQCHFLHEIQTRDLQGLSNNPTSKEGNITPIVKGARQKKGKEKYTPSLAAADSQATPIGGANEGNYEKEIAYSAREQTEIVRQRQEEAAREAREAEAVQRVKQEAVRLAKERAAIARHERRVQYDREREEARERERQAQRRKQEEEWARESAVTIQKVVLNSFVRFEAGLTVQHVICGFEASQILVKNLPIGAKKSEIIGLFTQQGIEEEDVVILRTETVDGSQQATLMGRAEDVETVAVGLDGIEFRDKNLEFVVCERSSTGRTMGSNRNSYHLNISWRPGFLTMLARYPHLETQEVARKARELDRKVINGHPVRAELHIDPQFLQYGDFEDYYPSPRQASIKISRISNPTTIAMVMTFAETQSVEHYRDPSSYTTNDVFTAVEAHIRTSAGSTLRTVTLENTTRPNFVSAKAIFSSWEGAKSAHDSLNGSILRSNFPSLRLFLSDPYRFVITLDEKQYKAQRSQWTELSEGRGKEVMIQTKVVDRVGGKKVVITLFGRDKKAVGALKVRIESMATGQKLDATYWHPAFKCGKSQDFLNDLYDITGAYVRCDRKHNYIGIYGCTEAVESAKSRIKEEVERISSEEWMIPLQRRALGFFIREGLAKMKSLLGEENVTLDVGSARIILHGADLEEARHHLRQLMVAFTDHTTSLPSAPDHTLCPICYDSVTQPLELSCGHIYCSPCLRHYVVSTLDNHNFPLKCMGDDATCNKPLSLPLIKKFLPPQRFEQLLESVFISYLDKNPETFKYCNTPDCSQVYRTTTQPRELQCPSCFSVVCAACHDEGHAGMTCAERRQHKDPAEQERLLEAWASENNVKKCPSCRILVEKTEGCNHISCKCGIHFCWICSSVFDAHQIYDHMTEAHSNWYEDPERQRRQAAAGQPLEQVPDIIQIVGGQAAVAEQAAELRRLAREHLVRNQAAARPAPPAPIRPVLPAWINPPDPLQGQPLHEGPDQVQLRLWRELRRRQEQEEVQRQALLRDAQERRERERLRVVEEAARRRREAEARRHQTEENKGWCIIM